MVGLRPSSSISTGCVVPLRRDWAIFCNTDSGQVGRMWSAREKSLEIPLHGQELNPDHREDRWWDTAVLPLSYHGWSQWFGEIKLIMQPLSLWLYRAVSGQPHSHPSHKLHCPNRTLTPPINYTVPTALSPLPQTTLSQPHSHPPINYTVPTALSPSHKLHCPNERGYTSIQTKTNSVILFSTTHRISILNAFH